MDKLLLYLARALVDHPDQVSLRSSETDGVLLFELKVAAEDIGKVIGRDGRTVSALRTVLNAAAQKQGTQKVRLEVVDDRRTAGAPAAPPTPPPAGPGPQAQ